MRTTGAPLRLGATVATALTAVAAKADSKPLVSSEELQELITTEDLVAGSQVLQDLADAHGGNRAFGGGGHNATVDYLFDTLNALDGYYDVVKQPFTELYFAGTAQLSLAGGDEYPASAFTYTPAGELSGAAVVAVADLGCAAENFPAEVEGNVALIQRGECQFAQKVTNAKAAGAVAAIIYNNEPEGQISGTLGQGGDYVPVVGVEAATGADLLARLEQDGEAAVDLTVDAVTENRTNFNVIAETRGGDKDNVLVLGGHSDSVPAGPGINDDGSGTIGILNVAVALSQFSVNNAVRFAFWGAEEFGKLGSYYYIKQLNGTGSEGGEGSEISKIRAYLNFDMIASPNYVYGIYDGDGNAFNLSGPAGSAELERDFEEFYRSRDTPFVPSEFSGRSDYAAFIENGIPSGGLFTGAEVRKTEEEAALFGGTVGEAYDPNYHKVGDTIDNLALDAFLLNTQSIANSVAKYALSFDSLPAVDPLKRRWSGDRARLFTRSTHAHSHSGPCGQASDLI